ncbi:pirin family protein [Alkalisalibacterium limincola]|uniref:Pirin family protein n=1 Tax=Alkalisalibacterium limincola TaxID=2699169 RepID=A0A5C8KM57_9GAMM|nr:pirin family protein [Alkalisalibacterium limincola]TXK61075.1 pirin family protein [Alkalisalibacterium limincola]
MIQIRRSSERGRVRLGWLDSRHTFSFGHYYDPAWMGFGPLRVINQDRVDPGAGFPTHGHANMEILSIVLSGALEHRDSTGGGGVIRPGELQLMSAGHGVEHSEYNASKDEPVEFLQVWIQPDRVNAPPRYAQAAFGAGQREGRLCLIASPDGAEGSLLLRQQARVLRGHLRPGEPVTHALAAGRRAWIQLIGGELDLAGEQLEAGDGAGISGVESFDLLARGDAQADVLVFDLP